MSSPPAARRHVLDDDESIDSVEVPAAVVCARCGQPDCPGCEPIDETTLPSGVISIVPWERPGQSAWKRLWATSRAATRSAPQFFQSLPPGNVGAAVLFAVVSELCAVCSWGLVLAGVLAVPSPQLAMQLLTDGQAQLILLRLFLIGTLGFTAVLVVGHLVYGLALDVGAQRVGARSHRSQAMRYGLYSTGWDILTSPLGFVVSLFAEGPKAALALVPLSIEVPGRAATALLRGVYKLDQPRLVRAKRYGTTVAVAVSVAAAFVVLALLMLAVIA